MVEIVEDPTRENRRNALKVYKKIKNTLLPEYAIYHSHSVNDYITGQGHLDCVIEKNTHTGCLFILNRKIGRFIYDGENSIGIRTDKSEKVADVAERLEKCGFRVVVFIYDKGKW